MSKIRSNDKRERLIESADKLIYEQTFHTTTLADIAKDADVPLGNVYYYFKTKEAILDAVLQRRTNEWQALFNHWEQLPNSKDRLQALVEHSFAKADTLARFGCVIGSLCQELGKQGGQMAAGSANLLNNIVQWARTQFTSLGKNEEQSSRLAEQFISTLQGVSLLALTFKEPHFLARQAKTLEDWLAAI